MPESAIAFLVDGFEVSATFAERHKSATVDQINSILISSFAANTRTAESLDILAIPVTQRYDTDGKHDEP